MIVKRIGPMSLARVLAAIYGTIGLIIGVLFSLASLISTMASLVQHAPNFLLVGLGAGAFIILPLAYGTIGFLMGLVIAGIYNLVVRKVGGVELVLE